MGRLMDQFSKDLDKAFYDTDAFAEIIYYDGEEITAVVMDPEEIGGPVETGLIKKIVNVRKKDISRPPLVGDQVQLTLNTDLVDDGEFWEVSRVRALAHEYEIYFERYVG